MPEQLNWPTRRSSPEEQRLMEEFTALGRSLEHLPYTPEFDELCRRMNYEANDESRNRLFRQLSFLRQIGSLSNPSLLGRNRGISREDVSKLIDEINRDPRPMSLNLPQILDAYERVRVPLDFLPYTKSFDELCMHAVDSQQIDDQVRRMIFDKLVYLKQIDRLPMIFTGATVGNFTASASGKVDVSSPPKESAAT